MRGALEDRLAALCLLRDHPRGCGEHPRVLVLRLLLAGSSPRMRGAPVRAFGLSTGLGIIPADAGSTSPSPHSSAPSKDHPRGCGEHMKSLSDRPTAHGSSPRMRGALGVDLLRLVLAGIIPADAGSTSSGLAMRIMRADHPRGCGEHLRCAGLPDLVAGSSPRMRGARHHDDPG